LTMADYDNRPRGGRGGYGNNRKRRYRGMICLFAFNLASISAWMVERLRWMHEFNG
jgi:hypothetical protein